MNHLCQPRFMVVMMGCLLCCQAIARAEEANRTKADALRPRQGEYNLADFGPVKTPQETETTLQAAIAAIVANGGGTLVIAPGVAPDWVAHNDAPSSTRPGADSVTIMDRRNGYEKVILPANGKNNGMVWAGRQLTRTVSQPIDMAFGVHSTKSIDTYIAGGTTSYYEPCTADAPKGKNQRVYVGTIRGLFEGMYIILYNPQEQTVVKSLGWDREKHLPYFVADLANNHKAGTIVGDKHVVNSLTITDHSQSDNQSMGLMVKRENYGIGDSFVISASACSMGNIMSAQGDEGGLTYAADIYNDLQPFRSKVEKMDWSRCELVYEPGSVRNHTLGTSRPILNMNPKKHIARGTVYVVAPGHVDPWDPANQEKTGKTFEKEVFPGGAIIGSRECGWTDQIVGRFFAIDDPTEYLDPKNDHDAGYTAPPDMRTYRWYQIQKLEMRPDGTKRLYIERTRWACRNDIVPKLYLDGNYTWDGHRKPLHYLIAPGAYVADVSRAWTDSAASGGWIAGNTTRTLKLAPNGDAGSKFDFEKGDPIVQAIGADPWNVTGMRVRHHNYLPSTIEDSSFQAVNYGRVAVDSALAIYGGATSLTADAPAMKDHQPRFMRGIDLGATTSIGLRFGGDVKYAAIDFQQPNGRPQPIVWNSMAGEHSLTVDPKTGRFALKGGVTRVDGLTLENSGGISATETAAHNLRGISVPVKSGEDEMEMAFERPEADASYALYVQPNWVTVAAVTKKTAKGFSVRFTSKAPEKATIDWILVR